jgi:hypothetical protein
MYPSRTNLLAIDVRTIIAHSVTYTVMGLLASAVMDYRSLFTVAGLSGLMRPFNDPLMVAAPLYQPLRGALFGLVFYLLREPFFRHRRGWLIMWAVLVGIGILGAFGPAPGSLEGFFFTVVPWWAQLRGLPEVLIQALLLSLVLFYWVNHPEAKWLNWVMGIAFVLLMGLPILGLLAG